MAMDSQGLLAAHGPSGDAGSFLALARELEARGQLRLAATAYDRAYGLDPGSRPVVEGRQALLDRLAVVEHGIRFRYIPAGTFLMGSEAGEPDEAPVHPVTLGDYWLSETPISWSTFCDLMGWLPPPKGWPPDLETRSGGSFDRGAFHLHQENKIRVQYCEDETTRARDWHAHVPDMEWVDGQGKVKTSREMFGEVDRDDPRRPWQYDRKPMVCVSWQEAEDLCRQIAGGGVAYRLPTEAEWEQAARGGLIGASYPWGDGPPDESRCDFDRFDRFSILPMRHFPPNGYGLYAMSGGVWEWTADWYDAAYYRVSPPENPRGPEEGHARVLRGGSWTDCAEAVTVTFRMPRASRSWNDGEWGDHLTPNVGFRLCRVEVEAAGTPRTA